MLKSEKIGVTQALIYLWMYCLNEAHDFYLKKVTLSSYDYDDVFWLFNPLYRNKESIETEK